jgi:hypothetical protein
VFNAMLSALCRKLLGIWCLRYAALVISPERRHREQTFIRIVLPSLTAFTLCRLGYQTFWVLLLAWLTLWPKTGPFPQISQTFAISEPQSEFQLE